MNNSKVKKINDRRAFNSGHNYSNCISSCDRDKAYFGYRVAIDNNNFDAGRSASICFVAGYLGKRFPSHDKRIND